MLQLVQSPSKRVQRLIDEQCLNGSELAKSSKSYSDHQGSAETKDSVDGRSTTRSAISSRGDDADGDNENPDNLVSQSREINSVISSLSSSRLQDDDRKVQHQHKQVRSVNERGDVKLAASSSSYSSQANQNSSPASDRNLENGRETRDDEDDGDEDDNKDYIDTDYVQ